ncbi:hypothetical protein [Acetivibrio clariflavus]|nr:hypothetical protein [Acetivibrio clariflavus]
MSEGKKNIIAGFNSGVNDIKNSRKTSRMLLKGPTRPVTIQKLYLESRNG